MLLATGAMLAAAAQDGEAPVNLPEGQECLDCHQPMFDKKSAHRGALMDCEPCHEPEEDGLHAFITPVGPEELCTQCHDDMEFEGTVHKPVEEGNCMPCHDPHASNRPKLFRGTEKQVCGKCHDVVRRERKEFVHGPFAVGACSACHAPHASTRESFLRRDGPELCLGCHEQLAPTGAPESATWHRPVTEDCTLCHSGHESDAPKGLHMPVEELCVDCHTEQGDAAEESRVKHPPVMTGKRCVTCHLPHVSEYDSLLEQQTGDMCLGCHDREYEREGKRPLADLAKELRTLPHHHGPVKDNACEGCHLPHGSENGFLLREAYPEKFYDKFDESNYALCFGCHEKDRVTDANSTATEFRDGDRNLHFLHVNRKKGRTCRACHAVHASTAPHHLRETTPFGTWELPINFEQTETGGRCEPGCHIEQEYNR